MLERMKTPMSDFSAVIDGNRFQWSACRGQHSIRIEATRFGDRFLTKTFVIEPGGREVSAFAPFEADDDITAMERGFLRALLWMDDPELRRDLGQP
jgi:hypothetical protein